MDKEKTPEGDTSEEEVIEQSEHDQVESEDSSEQTKEFDKDTVLKNKLDEAYGLQEDLKGKYLRSVADLENLRKRSIRDREDAVLRTRAQIIGDLLPVLDAFQLGLNEAQKNKEAESVVAGFSMAMKQMNNVLGEFGLKLIDPLKGEFDPKIHEAIGYEESEEHEEGMVLKCVRVGYQIRDQLLRPATVILSKTSKDKAN
jgi:molecular chaperone GrpE